MNFYVSTFANAEILHVDRYGPDNPGREGTVKVASLRILDETLRCIDSPDVHSFGVSSAISFFVDIADETTFNSVFDRLSEQASIFMSPD